MKVMTGNPIEAAINPEDITLTDDQLEILEKYTSEMQKFISAINMLPVRDTTIDSIINAEVKYFFDGSKTADEVASVIQNKVELYLNE